MNLFNFNSKTRKVTLDFTQIRFAHVVVQVNEAFIRRKSDLHKSLALKIERAKNVIRRGEVVKLEVTEEEKKLMREYNDYYCEILRDKMVAIEDRTGEIDSNGLATYALSTQVQLLFSPIQ